MMYKDVHCCTGVYSAIRGVQCCTGVYGAV